MAKRLTRDEFIEQLAREHPNLELLSDYNGNKEYVTVRCKKHDYTFKTKPNWLHAKRGCQKCYDERRGENTRSNLEDFVKKANEIHGDKYDYSKVDYVNNKTKIIVICKEHGEFLVRPDKHLSRGDGCPKCANISNGLNKRLKYSIFLERALQTHGHFYSYDETTYTSSEEKMKIICPNHGEFWQSPFSHTSGYGCPKCNESRLEHKTRMFLEKNNIEYIYQASKTDLPFIERQTLDFYLPKYNMAIECQGKQHFFAVEYFGGEKCFEIICKRDLRKHNLLKENNISLTYIVDDDININELNNELYTLSNTLHINRIEEMKL